QQNDKEVEAFLSKLQPTDYVILLDELGKQMNSTKIANEIQNLMNQSVKQVVFLIGGPYGFTETIYKRANRKLTLSDMTFTHQMVRLFLTEQIYRAFTILHGKPYHHEGIEPTGRKRIQNPKSG